MDRRLHKGISIAVSDATGKEIQRVEVEDDHVSLQKPIDKFGIYRICIEASKDLFKDKDFAKYEMSLVIEGISPDESKDKQSQGNKTHSEIVTKDQWI